MDDRHSDQTEGRRLPPIRRRATAISAEGLITRSSLAPDQRLPLVIQPAVEGLDIVVWATNNRPMILSELLAHGGLLFRGFTVPSVAVFEQFIMAVAGALLEYSYRSTPRTQVSGRIYTSTEYPANQSIPMHNEMAYTRSWPMKIGFCCLIPAQEGGATPIADSRGVFRRIDPRIRERFAEKQVMYVRNYGAGLDLPWQEVFQTEDKAEVEAYCRHAGIDFAWRGEDWLRTSQVCQAVATHPQTGEQLWFNQAHLFHVSALPDDVREVLLATFPESDLPRNTYYGDGTPIEPEVLAAIRDSYAQETISFAWQEGDIMLLDNMLVAHGRAPYVGPRKVVVGMAEPMSGSDL